MDPPESSAEVRAFYERHPYPAPVTDLGGYRERWEQGERRQAAFHVLWPEEPYRDDLEFIQRLWRHDQIVLDASRT